MTFIWKQFNELSLEQLYAIMRLRQEVFTVEQDCAYLDADGKDQNSLHLMLYEDDELIGYTRIVPPGISYNQYSSIGRVVTSIIARGRGIGHKLMKKSIELTLEYHPNITIKISAQEHLEKFYNSHGFSKVGNGYIEDGIPHIAMTRDL